MVGTCATGEETLRALGYQPAGFSDPHEALAAFAAGPPCCRPGSSSATPIPRPPRQWTPDLLWRAQIAVVGSGIAGLGALILALPLVSILAFIWLWRDTADTERWPEGRGRERLR